MMWLYVAIGGALGPVVRCVAALAPALYLFRPSMG